MKVIALQATRTSPISKLFQVTPRMSHGGSKTRGAWRAHVGVGEEVILTRHQKGKASEEELAGPKYYIEEQGETLVFKDRETGDHFDSPSGLCRARLAPRQGKKGTNDWNGPMHCLVKRAGSWVPLAGLGGDAASRSSTPPPAPAAAAGGTAPEKKKAAPRAKPRVAAAPSAAAEAAQPKTLEEENAALRAELAAVKTALARAQAALEAALRI